MAAVSKEVTIENEHGFHARPVMQFVDLANRYQSAITVAKSDQVVDGKCPMEIMLLEAVQGTRLRLTAEGPDAEEAIEALAKLIQSHFQER